MWKVMALAALAAVGSFLLFGGSQAGNVTPAYAAHDNTITVSVDSDPEGAEGYEFTLTGGDCDDNSVTLDDDESHEFEDCDDDDFTLSVEDPGHSLLKDIDCEVTDAGTTTPDIQTSFDEDLGDNQVDIDNLGDEEHVSCDFDFEFTPVTPTPTVGPAATVNVQSSNTTLGCSATSIITVTVRDAQGNPVPNGALVSIIADLGTVSPTSGQTTADGSVFVFYTAPSDQGGTATITAVTGGAQGTTQVAINCALEPTQAPPPTTAPTGGIQPPNTGDGGLATGSSWQTYAGFAIIVASAITTLVAVRSRA